jgi:hypothetical protein
MILHFGTWNLIPYLGFGAWDLEFPAQTALPLAPTLDFSRAIH